MKRKSQARISQCMIVKNEENNIERALSWGKGIVSEQIVVDTGSTDRTVEIAERMGAKVYYFEWIDDFSAAKNFAISKAKYEWIALLDADEYFTSEDAKKLLYYVRKLQDAKYNSIVTAWVHLDNADKVIAVGTQTRIFRNQRGLHYRNRIHEYLIAEDGCPWHPVDAVEELSIYHTGYGEKENQKKTQNNRNLKMIQAELEEQPDNYLMLGYLGDEYYSREELDNAEEAFRKSLDLMPKGEREYDIRLSLTVAKLMHILIARRNTEEKDIMEIYNQAVELLPKESDFDYCLGKYFAIRGDFQKGEKYLKQALEKLEKYGNTAKAMFLSAEIMRTYEMLATCCYNNGNLFGCINTTITALKADRYLMGILYMLLMSFRIDELSKREGAADAAAVAAFLGNNLYDFGTLKDRLFVMKAAQRAGYESLIQVIRGMFSPEELLYIDQALAK